MSERTFTKLDVAALQLSQRNQCYFHRTKTEMLANGDSDEDIEMTLTGLIWDCLESENVDDRQHD